MLKIICTRKVNCFYYYVRDKAFYKYSLVAWDLVAKRAKTIEHPRMFKKTLRIVYCHWPINDIHVHIAKTIHGLEDYFYFKFPRGYTINYQAIFDNRKRFLHLNLGMSSSTNNDYVLQRSFMYHLGTHNLFYARYSMEGLSPWLIENSSL